MQCKSPLLICPKDVASAGKNLEIHLQDAFFADLEQEEIKGGDLKVVRSGKLSAPDEFAVKLSAEGCVVTLCDRCLEDLQLETKVEETLKVKDGEWAESDDPETLCTEANGKIDLSWSTYELIFTSLPGKKTHSIEECNTEAVKFIAGEI